MRAPLQARLAAIGLSQKRLAELLGHSPWTMSEYVRGKANPAAARHIAAIVTALELLTPEQRDRWELAMELDPPAPLPQRGRKATG